MINRDSTAEAMWAHVLTVWQEKDLPTPSCIDALDHTVWLPNNERGQVDVWAAALGLTVPTVGDGRRDGGTFARSTHYRSYSPDIAASNLAVMCNLDLGDAELHWSPTGVAASPLSLAARMVAAMLTPESPDLPAGLSVADVSFGSETAALVLAADGTAQPAPVDLAEVCRTLGAPSGMTDAAIRELPDAFPIHYAAAGSIRAFALEGRPIVAYDFEARAWSVKGETPAAPVAVSPERVEVIRAELSERVNGAVADYVTRLRDRGELLKIRRLDPWGIPDRIELVGGIVLTQNQDNAWSAVQS